MSFNFNLIFSSHVNTDATKKLSSSVSVCFRIKNDFSELHVRSRSFNCFHESNLIVDKTIRPCRRNYWFGNVQTFTRDRRQTRLTHTPPRWESFAVNNLDFGWRERIKTVREKKVKTIYLHSGWPNGVVGFEWLNKIRDSFVSAEQPAVVIGPSDRGENGEIFR